MILDNFPMILWINLDRSIERRNYMKKLLRNLKNTRITAVDGASYELYTYCVPNNLLKPAENACTCSHLKALKYFVDKVKEDRVIIFEDDVSFDFLDKIPYNWSDFEKALPNYNVIQLAISSSEIITTNLVEFQNKYYGTTAYLITKEAARLILDNYISKTYHKFVLSGRSKATADTVIYSLMNTYSIPIFTYLNKDSTIHPNHLTFHQATKEQQQEAWKNE